MMIWGHIRFNRMIFSGASFKHWVCCNSMIIIEYFDYPSSNLNIDCVANIFAWDRIIHAIYANMIVVLDLGRLPLC
uniref:Uncharacterized protein n=1 Tax=uncultured microorganism TaxID=358574 RepID=I2FJK8_9ZZZZ|nr:hypothetical protein [uncultured microorganism]